MLKSNAAITAVSTPHSAPHGTPQGTPRVAFIVSFNAFDEVSSIHSLWSDLKSGDCNSKAGLEPAISIEGGRNKMNGTTRMRKGFVPE